MDLRQVIDLSKPRNAIIRQYVKNIYNIYQDSQISTFEELIHPVIQHYDKCMLEYNTKDTLKLTRFKTSIEKKKLKALSKDDQQLLQLLNEQMAAKQLKYDEKPAKLLLRVNKQINIRHKRFRKLQMQPLREHLKAIKEENKRVLIQI